MRLVQHIALLRAAIARTQATLEQMARDLGPDQCPCCVGAAYGGTDGPYDVLEAKLSPRSRAGRVLDRSAMKQLLVASVASLLFALVLIAGCAPPPADPPGESSGWAAVLTSSRVPPGVVARHRDLVAQVGDVALVDEVAAPGVLRASAAVDRLAATADGRQLLSLLVACALPPDLAILARADGAEVAILGEVGLAPGWARRPLGARGRRWVSACAIARMSGTDVALPISMRGRSPALRAPRVERETWTLEEGAFFGDLFAGADRPLAWGACGGRDVDVAEAMGRVCAQEDPATPGLTRCGLTFAGACRDACASGRGAYDACAIPGEPAVDQVVAAFLAP